MRYAIPVTVIGVGFFTLPAAAQSIVQLPVDASNCAIARALDPSANLDCGVNEDLGELRGIVLKLDDELAKQKAEDNNIVTVKPKVKAKPAVKKIKRPTKVAKKAPPKLTKEELEKRKAAKSENGYFIQFAFGSFSIEPDYADHIKRLGTVLSSDAMSNTCIRVTGHTDTVGSEDYNKGLGQKRALLVATQLAELGKINPERIQIASAGETRPLPDISGDDPLNRRVEFSTKEAKNGCSAV